MAVRFGIVSLLRLRTVISSRASFETACLAGKLARTTSRSNVCDGSPAVAGEPPQPLAAAASAARGHGCGDREQAPPAARDARGAARARQESSRPPPHDRATIPAALGAGDGSPASTAVRSVARPLSMA